MRKIREIVMKSLESNDTSVLLMLIVIQFIMGFFTFITATDSSFHPLYIHKDAVVSGFYTNVESQYVPDIDTSISTYKMSNNNYDYTINQTTQVWVSKIGSHCAREMQQYGFTLGILVMLLTVACFFLLLPGNGRFLKTKANASIIMGTIIEIDEKTKLTQEV